MDIILIILAVTVWGIYRDQTNPLPPRPSEPITWSFKEGDEFEW